MGKGHNAKVTTKAIGESLFAGKTKDLVGHRRNVLTLGWNCNGTLLASGATDSIIKLWAVDPSGFAPEPKNLSGHSKTVTQLCWHPTSPNHLATASEDKTVRVWDARSGKCTNTIKTNGEMLNIMWSPDGSWIAAGSKGIKEDEVFFIKTSAMKVSFCARFAYEVNELCWSPDSKHLFVAVGQTVAGDSGQLEVFSLKDIQDEAARKPQDRTVSVKPTYTCDAHTSSIFCVKIDPTGQYMATGSADSLVAIWNLREMICIGSVCNFDVPTRALGFSHDGSLLVALAEDGTLDIISTANCKSLGAFSTKIPLNTLAWHPRQYMFAYSGDEHDRDEGLIHMRSATWVNNNSNNS